MHMRLLQNVPNNVWLTIMLEVPELLSLKQKLIYRSLPKKIPWVEEHLTSLPKRGVGILSTVSAFNYERAPMSCLQRLDALEANYCI